jgi:hypothetical protein
MVNEPPGTGTKSIASPLSGISWVKGVKSGSVTDSDIIFWSTLSCGGSGMLVGSELPQLKKKRVMNEKLIIEKERRIGNENIIIILW